MSLQFTQVWQTYQWWQHRLEQEFFSESRAGTPVLFFLGEPEMLALRGSAPVEPLDSAVSAVLAWHGDPYEPVAERCAAWKRTQRTDPPPCLPLLGSAVLAAANMRRTTPGPGAPAYYARLAEVLRPPWGGQLHEQRLKHYYRTVADLWNELHTWLGEMDGARGLSTIRPNPARSKIGYAQSQALVRASDHAALTRFFKISAEVTPDRKVDGARLLQDLAAWSRRHPQGLSGELRLALESDADRRLLEPLLTSLAESWDGTVSPGFADGLRLVPLRLVLEDGFTGWEAGWHADVVPGVTQDLLEHPGGHVQLSAGTGSSAYELSGDVPEPASALREGFTAKGSTAALRVPGGRPLLALREDPVAGGWTETDMLSVYEPYIFLFRPSGEQQLKTLITEAGQQWYLPEQGPLPGWQVTSAVEFTDESALTDALAQAGTGHVRYAGGPRLSLRNGLRTRSEWGLRTQFMLGGEPDLVVPEAVQDKALVTLDGQPLDVPPGHPAVVSLRDRGLTPGKHVLAADSAQLVFHLEEFAAPRPLDPPSTEQAPAGTVVVPLTGDARFLTAQGRFSLIGRPQEPPWWRQHAPGLCGRGTARVPVPADAVWLVVLPAQGAPAVTLMRSAEPEIGVLSRAAREFWAQVLLDDQAGHAHAALWQRYRQAVLTQNSQGRFRRVRP
ncbi:hypothetical protein [Streptomyces sp. CB02261]|uniref:hypothetical protein n=1 Tax=Streptomyces sp. CB02261 TaxID=1703940 RepID=UPI00093DEAD6|nr:hypothetical protein [Streptomyces sp. CB02261]OKJ52582.1 hypothetical protein AMK29_30640 [Streptomyces sp. CB02261]